MRQHGGWAIAAAAAITGATIATPSASACGGFFCQSAPMDQAGENILFSVEDDGTLVTHVQILYQGDADAFAWILPLPSVPTSIGVGSDALFTQLGAVTRPQFSFGAQRTEGTCRPTPSCPYEYDTDTAYPGPSRGGGPDAGASFADAGRGVTVYLRETVGPYDAVVLGSGSSDELFAWLDENGYDIPDTSRPIIGEYVAARHVFVAVKLVSGADTREIQPLVLRYREAQPCVPMRLTAIATVPDMPITAYFAAPRLATPNNYVRLEPDYDDVRLWRSEAGYYNTYVSNAVDDAGGRAWVTEYAGTMPAISIAMPSVESLRTITEPTSFLQQLRSLGFQGDSQLLGILIRFLPPPDSYASDPQQYYNCLWQSWSSAESCGYDGSFDPDGLVTALTEQIVSPRRDAQDILDRQPRLTRLYTTMSAEDMTVDPTFSLDDGLPDVSNVHSATLVTECSADYFEWSAPRRIELPSGTTERWSEGFAYPGTDTAYCEDMHSGAFAPWSSPDTLRDTARRRRSRTPARRRPP